MGTYLSDMQRALLQRLSANIHILLDNSKLARKGVYDAGKRLRGSRVLVCEYPSYFEGNEQPDDLSAEELEEVMNTAVNFNIWRRRYERARS